MLEAGELVQAVCEGWWMVVSPDVTGYNGSVSKWRNVSRLLLLIIEIKCYLVGLMHALFIYSLDLLDARLSPVLLGTTIPGGGGRDDTSKSVILMFH